MRYKKSYYLALQKDVKLFLKGLDDKELFLLKSVALSKDFKSFYKERQDKLLSPSLPFRKKELKVQRIY